MDTASNSSTHSLAAPTGYTLGQLRLAITNDWLLSEEAQQFLATYFLRKWHTANLLALLKDGCLHFEDRRYQVQWIGGKVAATSNAFCYLSFRRASSTNIHPVVLINKENH